MLTLLLFAHAQAAEVSGYFRLSARPDLVGGDGRLGTSAFYGRLLNEGPWGLLDLRQPLVGDASQAGGGAPWGSLALRVEGGTVGGGDPTNGGLLGFRLSQLYLSAGNVGFRDVTFRVGTLETTFGDLWLFDARPTQMLVDVLGASGTWARDGTEVMLGLGDAGWSIHGARYHVVGSAGGSVRHRSDHVEVGLGGQAWFEPADGDPEGPEDRDARAWKVAGTVGFGDLGPVRWNRLQVVLRRRLPDAPRLTVVDGEEVRVGVSRQTDQRHELLIGDEVELELVPDHLEVAAAAVFEHHYDPDQLGPEGTGGESPTNRTALSGVLRVQVALTPAFSLLGETSLAREVARGAQGVSTDGAATDGPARKDTWQGKVGVVVSPAGPGLGARPALRALYGAQHCSLPSAWPGAPPTGGDARWHHLVSLEAEAWF
ncbi:MAG: hypothetical protein Q8P18_15375 [Pseudomonadota bacterium]|nr:hypothetical protein [Pseudomonadota bacterium]